MRAAVCWWRLSSWPSRAELRAERTLPPDSLELGSSSWRCSGRWASRSTRERPMNLHPAALALLVTGMFACGGILGSPGTPTKAPGAFDLADGPRDPNGFLLDPRWNTDERVPDPRGCSWRFLDAGERTADDRKACNTRPVDPDFSDT